MSDRDRLVELLKEADDATEVHDCDYPTYEKTMQALLLAEKCVQAW